jgi:hypothetical protein
MHDPRSSFPIPKPDLSDLSVRDLAALSGVAMSELRRRGVVHSGDPAADLAELLVAHATAQDDSQMLVKARIVHDDRKPDERQLPPFRSWDFDTAVIVLFDGEYRVKRAAKLTPSALVDSATFSASTNSWRVMATDDLLAHGADWTVKLNDPALWEALDLLPMPSKPKLSIVPLISRGTVCSSKHEFERLLVRWYTETSENTLGDPTSGVATWITVRVADLEVYVHADTNREGVRRYLELVDQLGPGLRWHIRHGRTGTLNQVRIEPDATATKGWYLTTAEALPDPIDL